MAAGIRSRVAVSMDQFVIDVGDTRPRIGDEIVLFGPGDRGEPTAQEWADWAGTNAHEILTRIGPRVRAGVSSAVPDPPPRRNARP